MRAVAFVQDEVERYQAHGWTLRRAPLSARAHLPEDVPDGLDASRRRRCFAVLIPFVTKRFG
jgi:hypothetical protein